jgi:hypothetical protein
VTVCVNYLKRNMDVDLVKLINYDLLLPENVMCMISYTMQSQTVSNHTDEKKQNQKLLHTESKTESKLISHNLRGEQNI